MTSFATGRSGMKREVFFFRHSDSNSVRGRWQEEHGLFDCCVIKLFINRIREQAESIFLKNANTASEIERNVQEEKTGKLHAC